ncbi:MAG: alpha/beta hydrolase [bacterium]|nr:alpha/beta hydrolase [bacterium]
MMRTILAAAPSPLAVLLLCGACGSAPVAEKVGAEARTPRLRGSISLENGLQLRYEDQGEGDEVLVVIGMSAVGPDLAPLAQGRRVVAYDMRGRAASDTLPEGVLPSLENDVADLEALRAALGLERFAILANDYRAGVAMHYAAQHPDYVEALVVVSPLPMRRRPYIHTYLRIYEQRKDSAALGELDLMRQQGRDKSEPDAWRAKYKEAFYSGWVCRRQSLEHMRGNSLAHPNDNPERAVAQYLGQIEAMGNFDWRKTIREVHCPALVLYGDEDPVPLPGMHEWVQGIVRSEEVILDDCGRMPWIEKPDEFFAAVEAFLAKPRPRRR